MESVTLDLLEELEDKLTYTWGRIKYYSDPPDDLPEYFLDRIKDVRKIADELTEFQGKMEDLQDSEAEANLYESEGGK